MCKLHRFCVAIEIIIYLQKCINIIKINKSKIYEIKYNFLAYESLAVIS